MTTRVVPFMDGMKVGLGYNRLTGDRLPTPVVQGASITAVQGAGGQQVTADCTIIQDVETLHKSLGISVDAGGSYMGFSGSAKVDYANSCDFSSFSTYVVVRVSVQNALDTMDSPAFTPDADELLMNNNPDRFRQRFGDTFIAGVKKGGEYFAIYQITSSDQRERESVSVKVRAAYDAGPTASAHLNTDIQTDMASSKSHLEVHVHVFRQGTIGAADLNLEDIMKTAKEFPVAVAGDKAFPFAVLLQDYEGLRNPNDQFVYVDIQNRQDVLADLAKKRFEFLTLRDDLKYILKHSDDFQNADGTSVSREKLIADFDQVVDAINTMQEQASQCTRDAGKCAFTKFDTSKFVLPILAEGKEEQLVVKGQAITDQDPTAVRLRQSLPDASSRRGFNIGMAVAEGQTLPGPGKDSFGKTLLSEEQNGYAKGVLFSVDRNRNIEWIDKGIVIANATPVLAAARTAESDGFFTIGFDIATGLFGDPALGGKGDTAMGPGKQAILDSISENSKRGFQASMKLHLGPPPLARR